MDGPRQSGWPRSAAPWDALSSCAFWNTNERLHASRIIIIGCKVPRSTSFHASLAMHRLVQSTGTPIQLPGSGAAHPARTGATLNSPHEIASEVGGLQGAKA